jgi:hypothetical protein
MVTNDFKHQQEAVDRNSRRFFGTKQGVKGAFGAAKRFHP